MLNTFHQDGKFIVQKKTDVNPSLAAVRVAKDMQDYGGQPFAPSDSWHVGRIDKHILEMWIKEAGLKWSDVAEVRELVRRKLNDGEFAAFRVKEGAY